LVVFGVLILSRSGERLASRAVDREIADPNSPANWLGQGVAKIGTQLTERASQFVTGLTDRMFGPIQGTPMSGPGGATPSVQSDQTGNPVFF